VVTTLAILGGRLVASGVSAGIGAGGDLARVDFLNISGPAFVSAYAANGYPLNASSIAIGNGSPVIATRSGRLFGAPPMSGGAPDVALLYGEPTQPGSEPLAGFGGTILQIGDVTMPSAAAWTFCIVRAGMRRCFVRQMVLMSTKQSATQRTRNIRHSTTLVITSPK
jgi:hypothetical protein